LPSFCTPFNWKSLDWLRDVSLDLLTRYVPRLAREGKNPL
jgi:hypothetical protein